MKSQEFISGMKTVWQQILNLFHAIKKDIRKSEESLHDTDVDVLIREDRQHNLPIVAEDDDPKSKQENTSIATLHAPQQNKRIAVPKTDKLGLSWAKLSSNWNWDLVVAHG